METVDYTLKVPKEGKEILDAALALVAHFRAGKGLSEAVALLEPVKEAVDGASGVVEELKSEYKDELAAYGVHKLWEALDPPKPAA